jgi:NAD(P)-dependent dehydrogenase (short-subunit alcohol dehydrogenase family)
MSKLRDQVAVVTGATRGFGYALAQELLKTGASVVICGREQGNVDKTVENLSPIGKVKGIACDVSVPEQVYSLGRFAAKEKGTIDIWINNAGHAPLPGSIIDFSPKEALNTFRTNCMGVYNGTQTAFYYMLPRKKGTLVNIYGRGSRLEASSPTGLYASSKAWVTEFTRTLAQDYKGSGVQIVAFSPGMMLTDLVTVHQMVGERVSTKSFMFTPKDSCS